MASAYAPRFEGPLVSIIVPAYNAERYLARAIRSALGQTYAKFELLVVDDGSSDRTPEVIASFEDGRILHLCQPNRGQGAARNTGIRASTGRYITFLDADDAYLPQKVARQVALLEARPECDAAFCKALHVYSHHPRRLYVRRTGVREEQILHRLSRESIVNPNTLMVRAEMLRRGLLFREDRYYPEEWDLCLRLARAGCRFAYQDEALVIVEMRQGSNTALGIQWTLKRHTLEMLERTFAEMNPVERAAYRTDEVLHSYRTKLAWAILVAADPLAALQSTASHLPSSLTILLSTLLKVVPHRILQPILSRAWRLRQRLSLMPAHDPAALRAWHSIRDSSDSSCRGITCTVASRDSKGW